jgi:hypothetical protein
MSGTEPKLTACKDCLHYRNLGSMAWEQICDASPRWEFSSFHGERYQNGYMPAHRVNTDGACPKYAEKPVEQEK